jgi:hypothetical protein
MSWPADDRVCLATISWARSSDEELLLRRSLSLLAAKGLPVAVADRGTTAPFVEFLRRLDGVEVVVPSTDGLVAQVKAAVGLASAFNRPFTLYVEPDKEQFFRDGLDGFLERALQHSGDSLVLAARSEESFATYPRMQLYTEGIINHLCREMLEAPGDYSYGPFLMSRALAGHVATLGNELGWGWRQAMFVAARRQGLNIRHVIGDYPCPPEQRVEDEPERRHRIHQLGQSLLGILA